MRVSSSPSLCICFLCLPLFSLLIYLMATVWQHVVRPPILNITPVTSLHKLFIPKTAHTALLALLEGMSIQFLSPFTNTQVLGNWSLDYISPSSDSCMNHVHIKSASSLAYFSQISFILSYSSFSSIPSPNGIWSQSSFPAFRYHPKDNPCCQIERIEITARWSSI